MMSENKAIKDNEGQCLFPLNYLSDFFKFLNRNRDYVTIITYDYFDGKYNDYKNNYIDEYYSWANNIRSDKSDKYKIFLLIQHDVDSLPEQTNELLKIEKDLGIKSNVMIFNKRINRQLLKDRNELVYTEYPVDYSLLSELEKSGFVIGYHTNAYEQAMFDKEKAKKIFIDDVHELRKKFKIKYFSPHGGVRDKNGASNNSIDVPDVLSGTIKWVHNRFSYIFNKQYSDGGLCGRKDKKSLDLVAFMKRCNPGQRYRVLLHPQYYCDLYNSARSLENENWYKAINSSYGSNVSDLNGPYYANDIWLPLEKNIRRSRYQLFVRYHFTKLMSNIKAIARKILNLIK